MITPLAQRYEAVIEDHNIYSIIHHTDSVLLEMKEAALIREKKYTYLSRVKDADNRQEEIQTILLRYSMTAE